MTESPRAAEGGKLKYFLLGVVLLFNIGAIGYLASTQYFGFSTPIGNNKTSGNIFTRFFKDARKLKTKDGWVSITDQPGSRVTDTLRYVTIFSRHGSRGPFADLPNVAYSIYNKKLWPDGHLQLTKYGRCQMYNLGKKIRSLYNGFLSKNYMHEEIKVHSTNSDRTLMTAQLVLAGLYPPLDHQVWNDVIPWQPVPVYTTDLDHCNLSTDSECAAFAEAQNKSVVEFSEKYKSDIDSIKDVIKRNIKASNAGLQSDTYSSLKFSLFYLWELLHLGKAQNLEMPEWTNAFYPEPLKTLMAKFFVASTVATDVMIRLTEGLLFTQLMKDMEAKIDGSLDKKRMQYYSTHDFTILGLEAILGLFKGACAQYVVETGSALIFELHELPLTHQFHVKVLYINGASKNLDPSVFSIPKCPYPCDFETLKSVTQTYFVHNISEWNKECLG